MVEHLKAKAMAGERCKAFERKVVRQERVFVELEDALAEYIDLEEDDSSQEPPLVLSKERPDVCRYWLRGHCLAGDGCLYEHPAPEQEPPVHTGLRKKARTQTGKKARRE